MYTPKAYPIDNYIKQNTANNEIRAQNYRTTSSGIGQALQNLAQTLTAMRELKQRKQLADQEWANRQTMQDKQNFADLNRTNVDNEAKALMQDKALAENQYEFQTDQDLRERIFATQTQTEQQRLALEAADHVIKQQMLGMDVARVMNEFERTGIARDEAKDSHDYRLKDLDLKEKDLAADKEQRTIQNWLAGTGLGLSAWEALSKRDVTREGYENNLLQEYLRQRGELPPEPARTPGLLDHVTHSLFGTPLPAPTTQPTTQPSLVDTVNLPDEDKAVIRSLRPNQQEDAIRIKMAERAPEREEKRVDYNKAKAALAAVQNGKLVGKPIEILSAFADARNVGAIKEITPELEQIENATRKSLLAATTPLIKEFKPSAETFDKDLSAAFELLSRVKLSDAPAGQKNSIEDEITNKLLETLPSHVDDTQLQDYINKLDAINKLKADVGSKPIGVTDYKVYPVADLNSPKATKGYHFRSRKAMSPAEYARMKEQLLAN